MLRNTNKIQGNGELETLVQKKHFYFISEDKIKDIRTHQRKIFLDHSIRVVTLSGMSGI